MNDLIRKNGAGPYGLKLGGYFFKRLGDLLDYLFSTDMSWMRAFSDIDPFGTAPVKDVAQVPACGAKVFSISNEDEAARTARGGAIAD